MKDPEPRTKGTRPRVSHPWEPGAVTPRRRTPRYKLEGRSPGERRATVRMVSRRPIHTREDRCRARARPDDGAGFWSAWPGKFVVPAKFCAVGVVNALVDFGTLNLLSWCWPTADPVRLALYNTLALVLANANSYLFNTLWTFREQTRHDDPRQRVTFVAQALLNVGVSNGLLWLTAGLLAGTALPVAVAQNVAKAVSTVGASTFGFLAMRYVVFGPRRSLQRSAEGGSERVRAGSERIPAAAACRAS